MARMKFLCDAERCIECNACVTACKNEHEVPWGINRRRVVTINDGKPGERSISVACMHCSDAPALRCARWTASTKPKKAWFCTPRTCASVVVIVSMRARSARRSIRKPATSDRVARWTSVPSAPVARKKTTPPPNSKIRPQPSCGGQTADLRRDVLDQGTASVVMATWSPTSTASGWCRVASAPALGVGGRPTKRRPGPNRPDRVKVKVAAFRFRGAAPPLTRSQISGRNWP